MIQESLYACMHAKLLQLYSTEAFVTPWTVVHQAPLSMGFSRKEYWSGWPCLPPGDLPDPRSNIFFMSPSLAGRFFTTNATWEVQSLYQFSSVQSLSRVWLFVTPWTAGFLVHHQLPEQAQTHVHRICDAIQPSHPLSSPSAFNLSQHQGLF